MKVLFDTFSFKKKYYSEAGSLYGRPGLAVCCLWRRTGGNFGGDVEKLGG